MAYLEEKYDGRTTLAWWKESFKIATAALFKVIDQCAIQDVQVHNMAWIVQEAHQASLVVQLLSEQQPWYADYEALLHAKDVNDPDYWDDDDDDDDDEEEEESLQKKRWDDTFLTLGEALRCIKATTYDLDEWFRIGNKRRLGKHVWHNRRMFVRGSTLSGKMLKLLSLTDTALQVKKLSEPNSGASRSIKHGAVLRLWLDYIAPRTLATHANFSARAPPCVNPKRLDELLASVDKVTQAPIHIVAEVLIRVLNLNSIEKLLLPYLLAEGCCDLPHGGKYTMGLDPNVSEEALACMRMARDSSEDALLLGPKGLGWEDGDDKAKAKAEADAKLAKERYAESMEQAYECIDCAQLQQVMDFWCPRHVAEVDEGNLQPNSRQYFETRLEDNRMKVLRAQLMLFHRGHYLEDGTIECWTQGVRGLGPVATFRAAVMVIMAAVRLWKGTPAGLGKYLSMRLKRCEGAQRDLDERMSLSRSRLQRAQNMGIEMDVSDLTETIQAEEKELRKLTAETEGLRKRQTILLAGRQEAPPSHPLKVAIANAAASLVWLDEDKNTPNDKRLPPRIVDWFFFRCSLDTTKALLQDQRNGSYLVRYSLEPGLFVVNWSEGRGKSIKSARVYQVVFRKRLQANAGRGGGGGDDEDDDDDDDDEDDDLDGGPSHRAKSSRSGAASEGDARSRGQSAAARGVKEPATGEIEIGYGWAPEASILELQPTIPSLLYASRGVLQYPIANTVPQMDKSAGYL